MDAPDQTPEVRLIHYVVDRVPGVIRGGHVVEEEKNSGEELEGYQEKRRAPQGVEPGSSLGDRLVEEVLRRGNYAGPVLHPVDDYLVHFRYLGPHPADHASDSLSHPPDNPATPRTVLAC